MPTRGAIVAVAVLVLLAGCSGLTNDDGSEVEVEDDDVDSGSDGEADSPDSDDDANELHTLLEEKGVSDVYERTTGALDPDQTDAFRAAITGTDDEHPSDEGVTLLKQLETIEQRGDEYRDTVAASVGADGTVDEAMINALSRVLNSPEPFQELVFNHGTAKTVEADLLTGELAALGLDPEEEHPEIVALMEPLADGGYSETDLEYLHNAAEIADDEALWTQAESIGLLEDTVADGRASEAEARELRDSTGDGLLNGKARSIGLDPAQEHPEVGEVATTLTEGEYGALERDYLDRVADISEYQNNEYEVWSQAEQLGLLDDAVADGQVSDEEYWAISNDASNRLLNGMEDEFGTDPDRADTAGDGYEDHLKWGPLRDLGFEVSPDEPDVIVEVDATTRTDLPSSSQLGEISDLMATEPDERVNVHFERCDASVDPIYRNDDHSTAEEHKRLRGIGAHHVVMIDGSIHDFGGGAYWDRNGHSWAWIDGTMSSDQKAQTIAHELGHLFGLAPRDFAGIDSQEYDATEYDSVMNYNIDRDLTFSTGSPFDDYEGMADEKYGSWHQSTDELETMWEDGSVNDIAC